MAKANEVTLQALTSIDPADVDTLDAERRELFSALADALDYEQQLSDQLRVLPQATHIAKGVLADARKRLDILRPPLTQADLLRASLRQQYVDRGLPVPEHLQTVRA